MRSKDDLLRTVILDCGMRVLRLTFGELARDLPSVLEVAEKLPSGYPSYVDYIEIHEGYVGEHRVRRLIRLVLRTPEEIAWSLRQYAEDPLCRWG